MDLSTQSINQYGLQSAQDSRGADSIRLLKQRDEKRSTFADMVNEHARPITPKSKEKLMEEVRSNPENKKLYEAAQDFQAIFLGQMLSAMRKNLHKDSDMMYGGRTEEIFQDFLYDEYAKMMSKSPGFNLSDEIYKQLKGE
jgi:flagellar protein FlgJ